MTIQISVTIIIIPENGDLTHVSNNFDRLYTWHLCMSHYASLWLRCFIRHLVLL